MQAMELNRCLARRPVPGHRLLARAAFGLPTGIPSGEASSPTLGFPRSRARSPGFDPNGKDPHGCLGKKAGQEFPNAIAAGETKYFCAPSQRL